VLKGKREEKQVGGIAAKKADIQTLEKLTNVKPHRILRLKSPIILCFEQKNRV
jgi:hypothetical protein